MDYRPLKMALVKSATLIHTSFEDIPDEILMDGGRMHLVALGVSEIMKHIDGVLMALSVNEHLIKDAYKDAISECKYEQELLKKTTEDAVIGFLAKSGFKIPNKEGA